MKPLPCSYHEHNEAERATELIEKLSRGASIALVSDAGMPVVSDPGFRLVRLAIDRGVPVVPVPGPTAFVPRSLPADRPSTLSHFADSCRRGRARAAHGA